MTFVTAEPPADTLDPEQQTREAGLAPSAGDLLDHLEKAGIAEYRGGHVRVRRRRPAGCFLFGPYWRMAAGHYRLGFRAAARRSFLPSEPVLGVEIIALNRFQQAWRDFTAEELAAEATALEFVVPPELGMEAGDEVRFEFRFFHFGNADLSLTAVTLDRLGANAPPAPTLRRWRLFARLRGRAIGITRSARIRVSRWRPPRVVLAARRPYLPLPAGDYRLGFCCRAGRPRLPSE